jgi:hypothetical protein
LAHVSNSSLLSPGRALYATPRLFSVCQYTILTRDFKRGRAVGKWGGKRKRRRRKGERQLTSYTPAHTPRSVPSP